MVSGSSVVNGGRMANEDSVEDGGRMANQDGVANGDGVLRLRADRAAVRRRRRCG
ncbi:hypothetical protein BN940_03811 [Castellaniella defragrans 65Phen]|uniref:Uncharacterized protein n=1 Tax=Castellaniella defragrans (strain DSM 12143 / CCUG 39792 / 65Phen) TaxID=1437824 RepID=W8X2L2_CASD6|nr:hypothetical protein BN940_03811 [Castellaniella defragrans 65Phen]